MYLDGNKTTTPWLEVDIGFKKKKEKTFWEIIRQQEASILKLFIFLKVKFYL